MSSIPPRSATPDGKDRFPSPPPFDTPAPVAPVNPSAYTKKKFDRDLARWTEDLAEFQEELRSIRDERSRYVDDIRQAREKEAVDAAKRAKLAKRKRALADKGEGSSKGTQKRRRVEDDDDDDDVSFCFIFL